MLQDNTHGWSWSPTSKAALWNLEQAARIDHLRGHAAGIINGVAFSPEGQQLATASGDRSVCVFDTEATLLFAFRGHDAAVSQVAFATSQTLVSLAGGKLRSWPLEATGNSPAAIHSTNCTDLDAREGPWDVQMTRDYVLATHNVVRERIGCWQLWNGALLPSLRPPELRGGVTRGLAVHPTQQHLIFIGPNNRPDAPLPVVSMRRSGATVARLLTGRFRGSGGFHANRIAISQDGRWLAASTLWRRTLLWDLTALLDAEAGDSDRLPDVEACAALGADHDHVWDLRFAADGKHLVVADSSGSAHVFSIPEGERVLKLPSKDCQFTFDKVGRVFELNSKALTLRCVGNVSPGYTGDGKATPALQLGAWAKEAALVHRGPELQGCLGLIRRDGRLTLHQLHDAYPCCGVVDSYTGSTSMRLNLEGDVLCSKKRGLAGIELWDLAPARPCDELQETEGPPQERAGRLRWETRPTLQMDAHTRVDGAVGLSAGDLRLVEQFRSAAGAL